MSKRIKQAAMVFVAVFAAAQFVRPERTQPPTDVSRAIQAQIGTASGLAAVLDRACSDCHSNKTVWPWYTQFAPVSWWLVNHVNEGRQNLNISEFGKLPRDRQDRKLRQICDEVTDGQMPLSSYLPMHPAARLSEQDKQTLCDWTETERQRLNASK